MPTSNPRVNVTLRPEQYELLSRLAKAQGVSRSSVLIDLLETVTPVLERVVVAVEAAQRTQVMAREGLERSIGQAEQALLPHVQAAMGQLDWLVDRTVAVARAPSSTTDEGGVGGHAGGAGGPRRRPPAGGRKGRDPRPVTRGSGRGVGRRANRAQGRPARGGGR